MTPLKIIHCGIFNEYDDGNFYYGLERKISHGLHQNGHFVYDFSYRDWERNLRTLKIKNSGLKKMNEKLVNICQNIKADILLFAKAEKISISTIEEIKKALPNIKISMWYVDHLEENEDFFKKLNLIDVFFYANALNLKNLSSKYKAKFAFFPNISDPAFEQNLNMKKIDDIIYIARDKKEDNRHKFAIKLDEFCKNNKINHKIYASLGNQTIFGNSFIKAVNQAKIAINFNRDDELDSTKSNKLLGASDRMAQFIGCATCTFSPKIPGFEKFFEDGKDIVYFNDTNDCFEKIKLYLQNKNYSNIGKNGQIKAFEITNAKKVSKFMVELICNENFSQTYEWREYIYQNGKNI